MESTSTGNGLPPRSAAQNDRHRLKLVSVLNIGRFRVHPGDVGAVVDHEIEDLPPCALLDALTHRRHAGSEIPRNLQAFLFQARPLGDRAEELQDDRPISRLAHPIPNS